MNRTRITLTPSKSALLVVDMQRYFLDEDGPAYLPAAKAVLPEVSKLVQVFHKSSRPVVFTKHVHKGDGSDLGIMGLWWNDMCEEGSKWSEIHPNLSFQEDDKLVTKHRYSAFYGTDLEIFLRCSSIEDLVVVGVMTNLCCESTARDAFYRDFKVFFPANGTATISEEMHTASLINLAYGFAVITTMARVTKAMG
jgi:nicotinamidase-related amidase